MTADLATVARSLFILLLLLLISRILGRRTLSELTFYDFVIGLVIGHIGGSVITDEAFSIRSGVVALAVSTLWILAIDLLCLKSVPARKLIEAEPLLVISKGKILEENLKKRYYNVNDLLEMLREQGTFDPSQVEVALIEADGQLSILNKMENQTSKSGAASANTQNQAPASNLAGSELILDGQISEQGLARSGLTPDQLTAQLNRMGITEIDDVLLAMITPEGKLYVDRRKDTVHDPNTV